MQNTRHRGQAATEVLATYGWAVFVILIVIGIAYNAGIFSLDRYLPSQCAMLPDFPCVEYKIAKGGDVSDIQSRYTIMLFTMNGLSHPINITKIVLSGDLFDTPYEWTGTNSQWSLLTDGTLPGDEHKLPKQVNESRSMNISIQNVIGKKRAIGDNVRVYLNITYVNCGAIPREGCIDDFPGTPYTHTMIGVIRSSIEIG